MVVRVDLGGILEIYLIHLLVSALELLRGVEILFGVGLVSGGGDLKLLVEGKELLFLIILLVLRPRLLVDRVGVDVLLQDGVLLLLDAPGVRVLVVAVESLIGDAALEAEVEDEILFVVGAQQHGTLSPLASVVVVRSVTAVRIRSKTLVRGIPASYQLGLLWKAPTVTMVVEAFQAHLLARTTLVRQFLLILVLFKFFD